VVIKAYIVYCYTIYRGVDMHSNNNIEEVRWQVIKAMIEESPKLKEKLRQYLKEPKGKKVSVKTA